MSNNNKGQEKFKNLMNRPKPEGSVHDQFFGPIEKKNDKDNINPSDNPNTDHNETFRITLRLALRVFLSLRKSETLEKPIRQRLSIFVTTSQSLLKKILNTVVVAI